MRMLVVRTSRERCPGVGPGGWGGERSRGEPIASCLIEHERWGDVASRDEGRTTAASTRGPGGGLRRWEGGNRIGEGMREAI